MIPLDLLLQEQGLDIAELLDTGNTPLVSNTRLLVSSKWRVRVWLQVRVDPDRSRLKLLSNSSTLSHVSSPDGCTKSHLGVVRTLDDLVLGLPGENWENWAEWLLGDDAGVVLWTVDEGWLDEEAWGVGWVLAANGNLPALLLNVLEEFTNSVVPGILSAINSWKLRGRNLLHRVLDWSVGDALLNSVTELHVVLDVVNHGISELVEDALVDVNALDSQADLTGVGECDLSDLWCGLLNVNVLGDNAGVVASKLESDALEGLGARLHDLLTSEGRAGEGDLVNLQNISHMLRGSYIVYIRPRGRSSMVQGCHHRTEIEQLLVGRTAAQARRSSGHSKG